MTEKQEQKKDIVYWLANIPRWVTYTLIAIMVIIPVVFTIPTPTVEVPNFVSDAYNKVESLQPGALVLCAVDMPPAATDEMNSWRVVLEHIYSRPGVKMVFVSVQQEAGPLAVDFFVTSLVTGVNKYGKVYGRDWIELGYLAGDAAVSKLLAVSFRSATKTDKFGTSFDNLPLIGAGNDLGIKNFTMVVHASWSQAWIDQWRWAYKPYIYFLSVSEMAGFATAAAVIAGGQVDSMVPGIIGGQMYEQLWNKPGLVSKAAICMFTCNTLLLVYVIIGNVAFLILKRRGAKK